MDKRCETCKAWRRNDPEEYPSGYKEDTDFGECNDSHFKYGHSSYLKTSEKHDTSELLYEDYEWYKAGFETGKDFGCIHWEEKDAVHGS